MTREEAVSIIEERVCVTEYVESSYVDGVDIEALRLAIKALTQPEIIRCKDCRFYEWMSNRVPEEQTWYCHNWNTETGKDDYCSYADMRGEQE